MIPSSSPGAGAARLTSDGRWEGFAAGMSSSSSVPSSTPRAATTGGTDNYNNNNSDRKERLKTLQELREGVSIAMQRSEALDRSLSAQITNLHAAKSGLGPLLSPRQQQQQLQQQQQQQQQLSTSLHPVSSLTPRFDDVARALSLSTSSAPPSMMMPQMGVHSVPSGRMSINNQNDIAASQEMGHISPRSLPSPPSHYNNTSNFNPGGNTMQTSSSSITRNQQFSPSLHPVHQIAVTMNTPSSNGAAIVRSNRRTSNSGSVVSVNNNNNNNNNIPVYSATPPLPRGAPRVNSNNSLISNVSNNNQMMYADPNNFDGYNNNNNNANFSLVAQPSPSRNRQQARGSTSNLNININPNNNNGEDDGNNNNVNNSPPQSPRSPRLMVVSRSSLGGVGNMGGGNMGGNGGNFGVDRIMSSSGSTNLSAVTPFLRSGVVEIGLGPDPSEDIAVRINESGGNGGRDEDMMDAVIGGSGVKQRRASLVGVSVDGLSNLAAGSMSVQKLQRELEQARFLQDSAERSKMSAIAECERIKTQLVVNSKIAAQAEQDLEIKISQLDDELKRIKHQLEQTQDHLHATRQENLVLSRQVTEQEEALGALTNHIKSAEGKMYEMDEELSNSTMDAHSLKLRIRELEIERSEREQIFAEKIKMFEDESTDVRHMHDAAIEKLLASEQTIRTLQSQLESSDERNRHNERKIKEMEDRERVLKEEVLVAHAESTKLCDQLVTESTERRQAEKEVGELSSRAYGLTQEMKGLRTKLQAMQKMEEDFETHKVIRSKVEGEAEQLRKCVEEMETERENMERHLFELKKSAKQSESSLLMANGRIEELERNLHEAVSVNQELLVKLQGLETYIQQVDQIVVEKDTELKTVEKGEGERRSQLANLHNNLQQAYSKISSLETELNESRRDIETTKIAFQSRETALMERTHRAEEERTATLAKLESLLEEREENKTKSKQKKQDLKEKAIALEDRLKEEAIRREEVLKTLEGERGRSDEERKKSEQLMATIADLNAKLLQTTQQLQQLQQQQQSMALVEQPASSSSRRQHKSRSSMPRQVEAVWGPVNPEQQQQQQQQQYLSSQPIQQQQQQQQQLSLPIEAAMGGGGEAMNAGGDVYKAERQAVQRAVEQLQILGHNVHQVGVEWM